MPCRLIFLLASFILITNNGSTQSLEPLDLAKKIFSPTKFPDLNKFITGEYKGQPNGQNLQDGTTTHFILLNQTKDKAVVALTVLNSTGKGFDSYLHFQKDTIWKMEAFRGLAMTGMIEQMRDELQKMTLSQVDEMIRVAKNKDKDDEYSPFSSREDYYFELGNANLTLELDDNIIKHFQKNKIEFERIKDTAAKQLEGKKEEDRIVGLAENLKSDYRKLFISSVSYGAEGVEGGIINFSIGGMLDNTVGYLYVKDKKYLPEMSGDGFIMLREIGNGWYLYKTT